MVLAMNIGNTNITVGIKQNGSINAMRRTSSLFTSEDDFSQFINLFIDETAIWKSIIDSVIISSVNPKLTHYLEESAKKIFSLSPLTVCASTSMKLNLSGYDTSLIGSDRIAVCEAAAVLYALPAIVFDFGTATTINIIDENSRFLGGSILPGLMMGINSLAKNTALLPHSEVPSSVVLIGRNTRECIASGAVFGNAAMLDGMTARIESLLGKKASIIVTGGNANYILPHCETKVIYHPELLLEGLFCIISNNN